jgi:glucose-6-phosphate dehydrogenase assembly protein OpcA
MSEPARSLDATDEVVFEMGIDLGKLRQMLQQARERRAGKDADERVCTLNLVAVYFSEESYEKGKAALEAAGTVHPARLLVLVSEPKKPGDRVRGQVSVVRVGTSIALERIVLKASGTAVRHLESALLGLLVPELPLVFVWGGRPEGALFDHVIENGDRVIIDSGSRPLSALVQVAKRVAKGAPIGDLAWVRLFPWQATAAEMLDLPNLREHRARLQSARVTTAGLPSAEGALLAGWFASRVRHAKVELVEGPSLAPDQAAPAEGARVIPLLHAPVREGMVTSFTFEAPPATFHIRRERGILVAEVRGDDDGEVTHRVRLPGETPGRLLGLELKLLSGVDPLYADALQASMRLCEPFLKAAQ